MQNTDIQTFATHSARLIPDNTKRRLILPHLIGMAIGSYLQIKVGNDLSSATNYASSHAGNVSRAVALFNENLIIDVGVAIDASKAMYLIRDRLVNGIPADYSASPEFNLVSIMTGVSQVMPLEVYSAINECGLAPSKIYSMALNLIKRLKDDGVMPV